MKHDDEIAEVDLRTPADTRDLLLEQVASLIQDARVSSRGPTGLRGRARWILNQVRLALLGSVTKLKVGPGIDKAESHMQVDWRDVEPTPYVAWKDVERFLVDEPATREAPPVPRAKGGTATR